MSLHDELEFSTVTVMAALPECSAPGSAVIGAISNLSGYVGTPNTPSFKEVKAVLASYHLPHGVVHEIHSCVLQKPGFEELQWPHVLHENLVFEPTTSAVLLAMHNLCK